MKIRTGFVSNSSSSSFVVGKGYMTNEQVQQFSEYLTKVQTWVSEGFDEEGNDWSEDTYIDDCQYYFLCKVSIHDGGRILGFLTSIGVDTEYIERGD